MQIYIYIIYNIQQILEKLYHIFLMEKKCYNFNVKNLKNFVYIIFLSNIYHYCDAKLLKKSNCFHVSFKTNFQNFYK